jgi:hypothetical protein
MGHYGYEITGGLLIFLSSLVSEGFPKRFRLALWAVFALLAIGYTVEGIHLDKEAAAKADSQHATGENETRGLKNEIHDLKTNTSNLISTIAVMFPMIASLNADLATLRRDTAATKEHHDPRVVANLERQAQAAQQQVDTLSHELLAITMAPQVAQQLRDWYGTKQQKIQDMHDWQWEENIHWREKHPNEPAGLSKVWKEWDDRIEKEEQSSREELSRMLANADFIRKELLRRIPPQEQSAEDKNQEKEFAQTDSDQESLEKSARYLEELARRVPPPPK